MTQQHEDMKFQSWAIVEIMGHSRFAGFVSTETIAGPMIRIDVPEIDDAPSFTKYIAPGSLFAITPCTEATARTAARSFRARPLSMFDMPMMPSLSRRNDNDDDQDDDWER